MRVLLWMVPEAKGMPGGHLVQLHRTVAALVAAGVDARFTMDDMPPLEGIDIVHGFGLRRQHVRWCRQHGRPVALSPVYCSARHRRGVPRAPSHERLHRLADGARSTLLLVTASMTGSLTARCQDLDRYDRELALAYESADLLLPNSQREGLDIAADLCVTTPWHYVPNAVDPEVFDPRRRPPAAERDPNTILCVGRFEPRKNQLGLIRALRGAPYDLVLVGPPHPDHRRYWELCQAEATSSVTFLTAQDPPELAELYARATVHALVSWGESTGLASLEAGLMGCNVVVSSEGYSDQYFGDLAWYCDPGDKASVLAAVQQASAAPLGDDLRDHIAANFTWDRAAEASLVGYQRVLNASRSWSAQGG